MKPHTSLSPLPSSAHRITALTMLVLVACASCINLFWRTEARPLTGLPASLAASNSTWVKTPVKAHLADGGIVIFRDGAWISRQRVSGRGTVFGFLSNTGTFRNAVPVDSIAGLETFVSQIRPGPSLAVSAAGTAVGIVATAGLMVAAFGSCPTVYSDSADVQVLEGEGFSYAIAPIFEHRDVDRLRARPGPDGIIRLELRNEALETHFINHIELLGVTHASGARVVPDQASRPVALGDVRPLRSARDRSGRDVRVALAAPDGQLFASTPKTVASARVGDLEDWIDIEADDLPPGDSVAVVMRLRNSLLNTVLLYEGMLGGADAPDWLGTQLSHIATVVDLARWYTRTMGMRLVVNDNGKETVVARLNDVGPIAFRDVAVVLPRSRGAERLRLRLRFVADNWRVDYAAVAGTVARPRVQHLAVSRVVAPVSQATGGPVVDTAAVRVLADADEQYFETRPGQRMTLEFNAGAPPNDSTTYLIAWQGWYQEWIRGSWLANPTRTGPFVPGDSAVVTALRRWESRKPDLEAQFYASKIPVR